MINSNGKTKSPGDEAKNMPPTADEILRGSADILTVFTPGASEKLDNEIRDEIADIGKLTNDRKGDVSQGNSNRNTF